MTKFVVGICKVRFMDTITITGYEFK